MTTPEEQRQANIDHAARSLYDRFHLCVRCFEPMTLAEQLAGTPCPKCGAINLAGPIDPDQARFMLRQLQARRKELGLNAAEAGDGRGAA
jgi:hypothetical protein